MRYVTPKQGLSRPISYHIIYIISSAYVYIYKRGSQGLNSVSPKSCRSSVKSQQRSERCVSAQVRGCQKR